MTAGIGVAELERFRGAIATRLGLHFDEGKWPFLAEVLRRRSEVIGLDTTAYLSRLDTGSVRDEIDALARELTVPETYFFRNVDQLRAFSEIVLPERLAARATERRLRILSLGCASGEEAYTLAILLRETLVDPDWDVTIHGVDVNPAMIEKGKRARYSTWALRETPDDKRRWFTRDGREFILEHSVRESVRFEVRNLVDDDPGLWLYGAYDVIFCRNVIMYFAPDQARAVVERIARALSPGGYLFLGHAETLRGLSNDFHLEHTHGAFYYRLKGSGEISRSVRAVQPVITDVAMPSLAALADADTWVDAIRRASERVAALTEPRDADSVARAALPKSTKADLGFVLELLRKERFAEALEIIDRLPADLEDDPDVLLLRAVLLTQGGQLRSAEDTCQRLLRVDELNAGAHYLLALCREGLGDRAAASYHDQVAAYLDPGFAMPRLHLGLLARRAGKIDDARRDLGQALVLLQREDASRIILFGGGFGRDALVALCRTELLHTGGKA